MQIMVSIVDFDIIYELLIRYSVDNGEKMGVHTVKLYIMYYRRQKRQKFS